MLPFPSGAVIPSRLKQLETCNSEIWIESESSLDTPALHHKKADVIYKTQATFAGSLKFSSRDGVQVAVHPFDVKGRRIFEKLRRNGLTEAALKQRNGFQDDVVVRHQLFLQVQYLLESAYSYLMIRVRLVSPGVNG
jgi:hypothetical protein